MLIAFLVGAASIVPASAQAPYPNRPIRIVVPFGAGGFADITVRLLAQRLAERTGAQVVVENRPGAGGIVAATAVTSSEADGYTLFVFSSGIALSKALLKSMPFDPVSAFAPISTMALFDLLLLVKADSPMQTLKDVLAAAGADPKSFQRRHDQSRQHPERHRRTAPRRRRHSDDGGDTPYLGGGSDLAAPGRYAARNRDLRRAQGADRRQADPRRRLVRQQALAAAAGGADAARERHRRRRGWLELAGGAGRHAA